MKHSLPALPPRPLESHKGDFGRGMVIGGSTGMAGAAAMAAHSALRGGAGLITVAAPESILPVIAATTPCPTLMPFCETESGSFAAHALPALLEQLERFDAAAAGPGLGTHPSTCWFTLNLVRRITLPAVLDADALNNLSTSVDTLRGHQAPLILTPHPGEMARLAKVSTKDVQANRKELAVEFAARYGVVLALKGHNTIVTDGQQTWINETGNPGMATGGSGDILTGLILAFLCQKLPPFEAAQLGVYVHGLAGDIAAARLGETALIATDIIDALPEALQSL